ncbi:MAG: MBL fold metallo-hydrolase [Burkholderiaceae bacterium]
MAEPRAVMAGVTMVRWQRLFVGAAVLAAVLSPSACAYLQHPKFGAHPEGERLERIRRSPQHAGDMFRYPVDTPTLVDGQSTLSVLWGNLREPGKNLRPAAPVPSVKTDLRALDAGRDAVVWLGHSSYFVILAGQRILIDPVFSPYAAPVSFSTRAFDGTTLYTAADMPPIDLLLITHDHWDHLDHATVTALADKVRRVVVPLGVGAHLERWKIAPAKIDEVDWFEYVRAADGLSVHAVPARHYSGRWLTRNRTLWAGFVLESDRRRLLFSGDTGYGPHVQQIARRFDGFDLVALDMGQYDERWPLIHLTPEEAALAAVELRARSLLPGHVGRFSIARHAWSEPFERIDAASTGKPYRLLTPMIGEPVWIADDQRFPRWWHDAARVARSPEPVTSR